MDCDKCSIETIEKEIAALNLSGIGGLLISHRGYMALLRRAKQLQAELCAAKKETELTDKLCPIGQTATCGYWAKQQRQIDKLMTISTFEWADGCYCENCTVERMYAEIQQLQAKNTVLADLLRNMLVVDAFKFQDSCCQDCDTEEEETRNRVRTAAKTILEGE